MGLIRKTTSIATLGGVKYTSRREAQTKAAAAEGKAARQEAKLLKAQRKAQQGGGAADRLAERNEATLAKWEPVVAAIESRESSWADLSRLQKMSMPIALQMRCKAAERRGREAAKAGESSS